MTLKSKGSFIARGDFGDAVASIPQISKNIHTQLTGWRIGIGIKQQVSHHVMLFCNYVFTGYNRVKAEFEGGGPVLTTPPIVPIQFEARIKDSIQVMQHNLMLGVDFYFSHMQQIFK